MMNNVGVASLGCSKNTVDTERLLGELCEYGFNIVSSAEAADIIIVNTCGFIESAKQDSIDTILEMAKYKSLGTCKLLVVTGCLSQRYPDELKAELPEVDVFWGVKRYEKLAERIAHVCGKNKSVGISACGCPARLLTTPSHRAYLRIADGCDNRCTYCAIPLIRGGRVSVPIEQLVLEARQLAESGVTELTVIAQDTSAYGIDIYGRPMLKELLEELTKLEKLHWVRLLYTYPNTVTEELIDAIAANPKICNYIDMPIQHISASILESMNRHGSAKHIRDITDYIRKRSSEFILRTTVMLGFPGETDDDFNELMTFLREHPFDRVGAFTFSPEDGTEAAGFEYQIDEQTARQRLDMLMRQQQTVALESNMKRVGSTIEVLIDKIEDGIAYCRSYAEAAEVDGYIMVAMEERSKFKPGEYHDVIITAAEIYDLWGTFK